MMNEIIVKKQELRKEYKQIRNNIIDKANKSKIITNKVIEDIDYKNANIIALFKSFGSEIDTTELIKLSIENGKIVLLPKVVKDKLRFYKIKSLSEILIKSKFGVEEPVGNEEHHIENQKIDLVIVPGLCFDKENNRLGYGKGYYDRFLKDANAKSIAICFKEQILKNSLLPITDKDVKVQRIITE